MGLAVSRMERELSPAILLSLALHGVLAAVFLLGSYFFSSHLRIPPRATHVSLVSLKPAPKPGGGTKSLPKTTVEQMLEQKPAPVPAPAPEKPAPVKPPPQKADVKAVPVAPKPADLKKEIARVEREIKLKEALAGLKSELPAATPPPVVPAPKPGEGGGGGEGAGGGFTGGSTLGAAAGLELAQYTELVRAQVLANWNLPASSIATLPKDIVAVILVYINEDGSIQRMEIEKSSQVAFYDQSATRAIRRAAPLAAPPKSLVDETKSRGIAMRFSPQKVGRIP